MKKLLVIEDDIFLNRVYNVKLKLAGFEVVNLENGAGASDIVTKEKPDLIILDILMPKKDGFETLKELKGIKIPIIVLTNLTLDEDLEEVMKYGATACYIKTDVTFNEVIDIINKHIV